MKNSKKKLFIALIFFIAYACSQSDQKIKKAKQLQKGMTMSEVKSIMGIPTDSMPGYFDRSKIMFLYRLSWPASDNIQVYFDSTSLLVTNIMLPKGE